MSTERSSSAVRNLRSIFETKDTEVKTPDRARSTSQDFTREGRRPLSKVRSSFVTVEGAGRMAQTVESSEDMAELKRESSASRRRPSFSENGDDRDELLAIKRIVSQESERREKDSTVQETIPEAAIESTPISTPTVELKEDPLRSVKAPSKLSTSTTANPDKPTTATDEENVALKPGNPTDAGAVSLGAALDDEAEDISKSTPSARKPESSKSTASPAKSKPTPIPSETTKPVAPALKSPMTTKPASSIPPKDLNRKVSRSSLTAPTAASNARAAEKRESLASHATVSAKARTRESTRPLNMSSHLMAPTAASRAKHEQDSGKGVESKPTRHAAKPISIRPTPRTSLAHAPAQETRNNVRKTVPPDGSFLDRMMRPTAASQSRVHEKYDGKPALSKKALPLLQKKATSSKLNGTTKHTTSAVELITSTAEPAEDEDSIFDLSSGTSAQPPAHEESSTD